MIFQHTWQKVLDGSKTQTRRVWKDSYELIETRYMDYVPDIKLLCNGRTLYQTDNTYAVQPGRGKSAVGRIQINYLWRHDVRDIGYADILAEGFTSRQEFLDLWRSMHGDNYDALVIDFVLVKDESK